MSGKILVIIILGIAAADSIGAAPNIKGYLASLGPSPIRFLISDREKSSPQIDYLPSPIQLTNNQEKSTSPLLINISSEIYGPNLPQTNTVEIISTRPAPAPLANANPGQDVSTNTVLTIPSTNSDQTISPQVFVNFFKNQSNLATNSASAQVIVVPPFTPPPPPNLPSSSSTYIVK